VNHSLRLLRNVRSLRHMRSESDSQFSTCHSDVSCNSRAWIAQAVDSRHSSKVAQGVSECNDDARSLAGVQ
jgi:hypothetical protein